MENGNPNHYIGNGEVFTEACVEDTAKPCDSPMKSLLYSELTEVVGHHKLRYKDMCKSVLK